MKTKAQILDETGVRRALMRIAHEIVEKNKGTDGVCLIGIKRRGEPLAEIIRENIAKIEGVDVPCGVIDITYYRDDLSKISESPVLNENSLPFEVGGKRVVIVDDVLYTGRTARAAIEAIFRLGRPESIQLTVLIDRGHRELPIRADYVGKNIPTSHSESIRVMIPPYDDKTCVMLCENDN
ncbi:MAG: bifunctional pyr operon transcriptional regulator/uracil phosphoribosyltransferase PyrR [Oscillospiraceae bacterium]|nr:bifunctional pyr operon transcriptional regulator/uracil phosphoribosyltransferase PyrR [Oscillospiraceae bacterium]